MLRLKQVLKEKKEKEQKLKSNKSKSKEDEEDPLMRTVKMVILLIIVAIIFKWPSCLIPIDYMRFSLWKDSFQLLPYIEYNDFSRDAFYVEAEIILLNPNFNYLCWNSSVCQVFEKFCNLLYLISLSFNFSFFFYFDKNFYEAYQQYRNNLMKKNRL